jgi:2-polyprenyl-3-methyl-5-hydroxy-6-metoxy-1,4-benzoquinol methylase
MHRNCHSLQEFYEKEYVRSSSLAQIPLDDDFMYAIVLAQIRPYLRPGLKVLDLGCNDGNLSLYMAQAGCEVLGIDLARNAVDTARRSAMHYGVANARFESLDFVTEWKQAGLFDFVLCSHVVEHIPDDRLFVERIAYALKPKGTLVLLTPTVYSSLYRLSKLLTGRFSHDDQAGHLRRYTHQGISRLIGAYGFKVRKVVPVDGPLRDWFILCPRLRRLNRIWARRYVRRVFNRVDTFIAQFVFPAAVCVHAQRQLNGIDAR